jgi:hypothetical protein
MTGDTGLPPWLQRLTLISWVLAVVSVVPRGRWPEPWQPWLVGVGLSMLLLCLWTLWRNPSAVFRERFMVLVLVTVALMIAPISTNTSNSAVLTLGSFFGVVVIFPYLWFRYRSVGKPDTEPVISFVFWPKHRDWREWLYVALSIPLAWAAFRLYFSLSPEVPFNWSLPNSPNDPNVPDSEAVLRLFIGINAVGIWDELFFVNTAFALLRSMYPFWWANWGQSALYVSVLYAMAFSGVGPLFVLALAITQGVMFERSKSLLSVLVVHLIVDYFLFQEILTAQYPGFKAWWHP